MTTTGAQQDATGRPARTWLWWGRRRSVALDVGLGLVSAFECALEGVGFADKAAMDRFKQGQIDFSANASAVVAKTGAAKNVRFVDGVAIFVRPTAGAMGEAVVAGQRATYAPK